MCNIDDGEKNNSQTEYCTKVHFVDIVLIMADFYCIIHRDNHQSYEHVCDHLAEQLSNIFHVPLNPYDNFSQFRLAHQDPGSQLPQKFTQKLNAIQVEPGATSLQLLKNHSRFEAICDEIERWTKAEQLAALLLPIMAGK
ncbi:hypothetical protein [Paraflavitalea pollutisoli]|uniref:hypothetical protein n=1 Tax=Paraflavitalea pollutisoli TaxID=3034143 RepID=UPI0023EB8A28|nr:hypothetical protein [Paraflavitalea sp. H1-2-19X]